MATPHVGNNIGFDGSVKVGTQWNGGVYVNASNQCACIISFRWVQSEITENECFVEFSHGDDQLY